MPNPDPDKKRFDTNPGVQWINIIITLLLVLAVLIAGSAAYYSRKLWWDLYLNYIRS